MLRHPPLQASLSISYIHNNNHSIYSHALMQRLRAVVPCEQANTLFSSPVGAFSRGGRGSGVSTDGWGHMGCSTPLAASSLRTLRPIAACANWSQAMLLSVEGDVYQWRVSSGRLQTEDDENAGGAMHSPFGVVGGSAGAVPTPLMLPTGVQRTPHDRFHSVSERLVVLDK
jgi:hypothetical protein